MSSTLLYAAVKQIARNDTNKKAIVEHGFLPLLVELAHSSVSKEQTEAVATLRTLSFDKENQRKMINDTSVGVVDTFVDLLDSKDHTCVSICKGALWTMREELQKSEKYKDLPIVQEFAAKNWKSEVEDKSIDKVRGHVMISYQWNNQETLIRIKEHLRSNGFKVWMDIDDMAGSTLEAMAKAVEEADVVLLCFSKKYKDSDNCRAEAEYAFEKRKTIVPLRMEKGYRPDGWLGIIVGSKKFYDFGGKYSFDSRADDLVKELHGRFSDIGIMSNVVPVAKHAEAVDVYYKTLTEQLHITDLNTMAKFTSALEDTSL
ncbi:hypothetical protein KUTeg_000614 [Tegillarca granosa]|uniref:TIR domain-containing protein n=1 Tax=Tegillarca granosa TaxID=220873 RepID=A0ABQ9FY19_TEGGR|nr:hypothetical protein KUTeg_000614 [Tegillarca granosa]